MTTATTPNAVTTASSSCSASRSSSVPPSGRWPSAPGWVNNLDIGSCRAGSGGGAAEIGRARARSGLPDDARVASIEVSRRGKRAKTDRLDARR